jgi:hypothetical protein
MPRNTRASFAPTLKAWQSLSADEQDFALDAVRHHRKRLEKEAKAANRELEGHMHFVRQTPAHWLTNRDFYGYKAAVEKDRAERITGLPPHIRRSEVMGQLIDFYEHYLDEERQGKPPWKVQWGDPHNGIVNIAPPSDPDCPLPADLLDEARAKADEKLAPLRESREQNRKMERQRKAVQEAGHLDHPDHWRLIEAIFAFRFEGNKAAWTSELREKYGPAPGTWLSQFDEKHESIALRDIETARAQLRKMKAA